MPLACGGLAFLHASWLCFLAMPSIVQQVAEPSAAVGPMHYAAVAVREGLDPMSQGLPLGDGLFDLFNALRYTLSRMLSMSAGKRSLCALQLPVR